MTSTDLTVGFSRLSVAEPHASSSQTFKPVTECAPAADHQELDKIVLRTFHLNRVHSIQPELCDLLSLITVADDNLSTLTPDQSKALIEKHPALDQLLQQCWASGSFKDVRQLGLSPQFNF
jgi:hypothetical protein